MVENEYVLFRALQGEATIGYVAGMVDAEGYIGLCVIHNRRGVKSVSKVLQITNTNMEALAFCQKVIGGNINRTGCTTKPCWALRIANGESILRALKILYPYLIVKREIAKLMIEFCESRDANYAKPFVTREMEIVTEMKKLNEKGKGRDV